MTRLIVSLERLGWSLTRSQILFQVKMLAPYGSELFWGELGPVATKDISEHLTSQLAHHPIPFAAGVRDIQLHFTWMPLPATCFHFCIEYGNQLVTGCLAIIVIDGRSNLDFFLAKERDHSLHSFPHRSEITYRQLPSPGVRSLQNVARPNSLPVEELFHPLDLID
jgi:hypothetical protein